jgi:hypothetical protein
MKDLGHKNNSKVVLHSSQQIDLQVNIYKTKYKTHTLPFYQILKGLTNKSSNMVSKHRQKRNIFNSFGAKPKNSILKQDSKK